jgi:DNA-binding transcriptional ArsR family regulator
LGITSRYQIYETLKKGPLPVGEVALVVKLRQPTTTYHLKKMEESGLLKSKKVGRQVYFEVNDICPQSLNRCILRSGSSISFNTKIKNVKN